MANKRQFTELANRIEAAQTIVAEVSRRLKNRQDMQPQHAQLMQAADLLKTSQEDVRAIRDAVIPRP